MPRKKSKPPAGRRTQRLLIRNLLIGGGLGIALIAGYLLYLDHLITSTFDGRRWSVPARVYAQPLELYPGLPVEADEIEVELKRLGYRRGPLNLNAPGNYTQPATKSAQRCAHSRSATVRARRPTSAFASPTTRSNAVRERRACELVRLEPPLIGSFFATHGEDRLIVTPEETPTLLSEGLKAVEDRNFDTHVGFDLKGIARAAMADLRSGDLSQGGSTLTQQLVKSYFLDNRRTMWRKLKEVAMAVILDARYQKADLLNAYINEIYLGQDGERAVHGFGLGSQFYFNKPLSELNPAEIALLIAVIRGPSYYNPFTHPERARSRRDLVLGQMSEFGLITAEQHAKAIRQPLALTRSARQGGGYYPAFLDLVRDQLGTNYDATELASRGYRVFTTLEPRVQDAAEQAVAARSTASKSIASSRAAISKPPFWSANNQTGEISAVVGGRKAGFQGFNRALNARRPVGSLLKPVVYLTALESGDYNLASIIEDAPLLQTDVRGKTPPWEPHNFDKRIPRTCAAGARSRRLAQSRDRAPWSRLLG